MNRWDDLLSLKFDVLSLRWSCSGVVICTGRKRWVTLSKRCYLWLCSGLVYPLSTGTMKPLIQAMPIKAIVDFDFFFCKTTARRCNVMHSKITYSSDWLLWLLFFYCALTFVVGIVSIRRCELFDDATLNVLSSVLSLTAHFRLTHTANDIVTVNRLFDSGESTA